VNALCGGSNSAVPPFYARWLLLPTTDMIETRQHLSFPAVSFCFGDFIRGGRGGLRVSPSPFATQLSYLGGRQPHPTDTSVWKAMALRWTAAGMMEAIKDFRRLKAHKYLPLLRTALAAHQSKCVTQRVDRDALAA